MYEFIKGKIVELSPTAVIIESGGVGYFLHISLSSYSQLMGKSEALVYVHFVVREDVQDWFGFVTKGEREYFRLLISVSGVGPNTARMVLSSLEPDEIRSAIATGNINPLKAVKGIGPKTAQRIIIDLSDKVGRVSSGTDILPARNNTNRDEAFSALLVLGFARPAIEKALDGLLILEKNLSVEELIKKTLKQL
jgi:Holliday junction DNA helicase RuvA